MLFIVTQKPKAKMAQAMRSAFLIVEAKSASEAIRKTVAADTPYISAADPDCMKPEAVEIKAGIGGFL